MARILGGGALTLLAVVVIVIVALVPLVFVFRSTCEERGETDTRYSFVPPWDEPQAGCRNQRGYDFLLEEIGL